MPFYQYEYNHREFLRITADRIKDRIYTRVADLKVEAWVTPEPVGFAERKTGKNIVLKENDKWGELWDCAWMNICGEIPSEHENKNLYLKLDICGEGLVCDTNGTPIKGITTVKSRNVPALGRFGKSIVEINDANRKGNNVEVWIDAGCNDLFGGYQGGTLKEAYIAVRNNELRNLYYDFAVLHELWLSSDSKRAWYHKLLKGLTQAAQMMTYFTEEEAINARKILKPLLETKGGDDVFTLSLVGHAHLDLAWTWPIRETIRKGARTFSTAISHMKDYPNYIFSASQAQLYDWVKKYYPTVFDDVKKKVKTGNWEITGGMWVEPDLNVTSGESLVRQFLYGQKYFKEHFGNYINVGWIPDSFGFTGALPQIMKKSGIDYFLTQKPRTSPNIIKYPHDVLHWEGIDGTKILTHFAPGSSYSSSAAPVDLALTEERFHDKMTAPACIVLFGQGDGGAGAGAECMESINRVGNIKGLPKVVNEPSEKLFERLKENESEYSVWRGPIDLDMHTGTFTTAHKSKNYNRLMENALKDTEFFCAMADKLVADYKYPAEEIQEIWQETLLYQFHDILPGTSIRRVYDESWERYEIMLGQLTEIKEKAIKVLYADGKYVKNTLSWKRSVYMNIDGTPAYVSAEPMSLTPLKAKRVENEKLAKLKCSEGQIENDLLCVSFNEDGTVKQIVDKNRNRSVLAEAIPSNQLLVFEDRLDYNEEWGVENAWDIPIRYADKTPEKFTLKESSTFVDGVRAVCKQKYSYGKSTLTQEIVLTLGSGKVDFNTTVDWNESERLLRTRFYPSIKTDTITRGTQFGYVTEKNDKNIMWNFAKFEVCGQRYLDMSLDNEGIAMLSPIKCGYRIQDGIIDLALLRSSNYPGEKIDVGVHNFVYSIYPHADNHIKAEVARKAFELDNPLELESISGSEISDGVIDNVDISVSVCGAVLESVKRSEDVEGVIIRIYEHNGVNSNCSIKLPISANEVIECDMLERPIEKICGKVNKLELNMKPFEVKTLLLK